MRFLIRMFFYPHMPRRTRCGARVSLQGARGGFAGSDVVSTGRT